MAKLYTVRLTDAQRLLLQTTISKGTAAARTIARARVLLKADAGREGQEWTDTKIAEAVEVSRPTVERLRKRAVTESVEAALTDRPRWQNRTGKRTGEQEARLTALRCSDPPAGQKRWTLHLLANSFGDREGVPISYELVRRTLKKNRLSPHLKEQWCIPPEQNAEFCWHMEDVLDVYTRPHDPRFPTSASMSAPFNSSPTSGSPCLPVRAHLFVKTTNTSGAGQPIFSSGTSRRAATAMLR